MSIGLVSEGVSDLPIIQNVIIGFTGNRQLIVDQLSPLRDETHTNEPENYGGWGKVLEYIGSSVFRSAFQYMDAIVIQIDTDVCEEYGVRRFDTDNRELEPLELIEKVRTILINHIGLEFYSAVENRVIFAIAVDSIECWLLPFYYNDNRASKHKNCIDTLNQKLGADNYTIDHKDDRIHEKLSAPFKKKKELERAAQKQASLGQFILELGKLAKEK